MTAICPACNKVFDKDTHNSRCIHCGNELPPEPEVPAEAELPAAPPAGEPIPSANAAGFKENNDLIRNRLHVGIHGGAIYIGDRVFELTRMDALNVAAWLILTADRLTSGQDEPPFEDLLAGVRAYAADHPNII